MIPASIQMADTARQRVSVHHRVTHAFDRFANRVTHWAGSPTAFALSVAVVLAWAASGPLFRFSEDWQLVVNTGTTVVTFLMVFLIQQSQNKDSAALHVKLNELIAANRNASNRLICAEDLDEDELRELSALYAELARRVKDGEPVRGTTSDRRRSGEPERNTMPSASTEEDATGPHARQ